MSDFHAPQGFDQRADEAQRFLERTNKARAACGKRALSLDEAQRRNRLLRDLDELNRNAGPEASGQRDALRAEIARLDDPEAVTQARPAPRMPGLRQGPAPWGPAAPPEEAKAADPDDWGSIAL